MSDSEQILAFWFDEIGPEGWYNGGDAVDEACRSRFLDVWRKGRDGALTDWAIAPRSALALVILLDQFPRNMFRGSGESFATDDRARALSKWVIGRGLDASLDPDARQFMRLPLMHSESLPDQEQCVRQCLLGEAADNYLLHARAHRDVIRRFGRFPFRNDALERRTSAREEAWLGDGGYDAALRAVA